MTRRLRDEKTLDAAIAAVRGDEPAAGAAEAAAARVWPLIAEGAVPKADPVDHRGELGLSGHRGELGLSGHRGELGLSGHRGELGLSGHRGELGIRGCGDVLALLPEHRDGRLPAARALLVDDHLRECPACLARFRQPDRPRLAVLPWRPQAATAASAQRPWRRYAVAAAVLLAAATSVEGVRRAFFAPPSGPRAVVESVSGGLQRLGDDAARPLTPGEELGEAETVRTGGGSHARLRLRDGSLVELSERAELSVRARGQDTTIHLARGSVIVQAAKRRVGRLLVASKDCTVQVTGTVFSVNAGVKGSRVSVIEGHVQVTQGRQDRHLQPGQQWASSDAVGTVPLAQEIAWSRDLDRHLALLAEVQALREKWQAVRMPGLRYQSPLLARVPAGAVVFASIPNYGETLGEAHRLFEERLQESAVLREWWQTADPGRDGGPSLASVIERVRTFADFLGDEVALAVVEDGHGQPSPVLLAEVRRPGLREFLEQQVQALPAPGGDAPPIRILDDSAHAPARSKGLLVLIQPDLVAISIDPRALRAVTQRAPDDAGFLGTALGRRVAAGYESGVGLLFAADLERITSASVARGGRSEAAAFHASGLDGLRHLIVESTGLGEQAQSRAALAFAGPRRGVASWLGAPAPMGSLDFFSPNAQAVAAVVSKSPALVLDDILGLVQPKANPASQDLAELEDKLDLRLREDLALTLGGEFAVALDGPLLPTPAWKAVIEVVDPGRLQASLQTLVSRANEEAVRAGHPPLQLEAEQAGGRTCYVLRGALLPVEVHYVFEDGYLVAGPTPAIVLQAVHTRGTGETLGASAAFRALFPHDGHSHVSGLVYQNLGGSLGAMLEAGGGQLSPQQRGSVAALARDAKPSLVCAYGEDDTIQVAGSGLLDIDPSDLSLPILLGRALPGTPRTGRP
jgi:hypothetical protein